MADYKRLVSYIYNYEAGIRKKNVGFSRVESKNGKCKVTVHITASVSSQEPLKIYLFHRNGTKMEGILFGNMIMKAGTGDFRGETSTRSLMGTGFSLDDISGVLVLLNENRFFGSQWDDQEIKIEDFEEFDKSKQEMEQVDRLVQDIKVEPQNVTDMLMEEELGNQISSPMQEETLQAAELDQEKSLKQVVETVVSSIENMFQKEEEEVSGSSEEETDAEEETKTEPAEETLEAMEEQIEEDDIKTTYPQEEAEREKEPVEEEQPPVITLEASSTKCCCSDNYPECVRNILRNFPPVKLFPDSNSENWVRIEPKDIGMLPVETWILANNSFLLHGYYNYRHLVFGILQVDSGIQYVIGVPGILQNTEQTMAGLFGFHRFLSANEDKEHQGNFGYWIQQIVL